MNVIQNGSLDTVLAEVPMPVVVVDPDERIAVMNPSATALFGTAMTGRYYYTAMRQPDLVRCISDALESGKPQETRFQSSDASVDSAYRVRCAPVVRGSSSGVVVSFSDVTPLETAGQMRRDFVANVSHELRTPLTSILGFIETLRGPARRDQQAQERFLETMSREAERMNRLIDDLLSLSRVESEERMRPTERVDLLEVVQSVCHGLKPLAGNVVLDIKPDDQPSLVKGDSDQLMQVFSNLIENALKYGDSGERVEIVLSRILRDPFLRVEAVQVDVRDFGAGIDEVHLHRLTERFYRADNHRSRELGGTGLGLAIVKHILNRHRGRLKIASTPGQGSCFTVILPRLKA